MIQRADIIFVTLYVYNTNGQPVWYAASLNFNAPSTWSGDLMRDERAMVRKAAVRPVRGRSHARGIPDFHADVGRAGTLSYSINGVSVNENIQRMTLRYDDYSGDYVGLLSYAAEGCPNPFDRGVFNNRIDFEHRLSRAQACRSYRSRREQRQYARPAARMARTDSSVTPAR